MIIKNPIVSVLMTAYNRESYIGAAIKSVLDSTFDDFELIIVDDNSNDSTFLIINEYAASDIRIKPFSNSKNIGDYNNRNLAASYASGKYLKYVDSDDIIYPWALEILVKIMECFPKSGLGLCSLPPDLNRPFPFELSQIDAYEYHYCGPGLFYKAPLSAIILNDAFKKVNGFKNIRMAGDFDMWYRLALNYPVVLMPQGLVWYRKHNSQEINEYNKYIVIYEKIYLQYLNATLCPLDEITRKRVIYKRIMILIKLSVKALLKLEFINFIYRLNCVMLYVRRYEFKLFS